MFWVGILFLGAFSCSDSKKKFTLLSPRITGIKFKNILKETKDFNVLTYGYLYNGGGIAIGDVNNDGLEDIYFTGNMVASRLYINQGNLNFKEVAEEAKWQYLNTGRPQGLINKYTLIENMNKEMREFKIFLPISPFAYFWSSDNHFTKPSNSSFTIH